MKILVGNNSFGLPGGSETYSFALIHQLVRMGHIVEALAGNPKPGKVSAHLKKIGVNVHFQPINKTYDLVCASHSTSLAKMQNVTGFKVQTCHGIFPKVEQPVPGCDAYVAISKEVQDHLQTKNIESTCIKNGVDCQRYRPIRPITDKLQTVLSLAHSEPANQIIRQACKIAGVKLIENNKFKTWRWDMENIINEVDLVISLGRGAYESMACGRNVVIFDKRGYTKMPAIGDGIITVDNVETFLANNCSGRATQQEFDEHKLAEELHKYDPEHGHQLREYALQNLNIVHQAQKYLDLL